MRTRDRDQDWIEELGRRRLEALIAELTPAGSEPTTPTEPAPTQPAPTEPVPAASVPEDECGSALPSAGRHARRPLPRGGRLGGWLADRLPDGVAVPRLHSGHLGVLSLVLAVAVVLGGWGWVRAAGDTPSPSATAPTVSSPTPSAGLLTAGPSGSPSSLHSQASPASSGTEEAAEVVVHVAGKVRRPGIVVLPAGSRVVDAVRRAGGFAPGVGPRSAALNLARVLVDGEQIVVGGGPGAAAAAVVPGDTGAPGALVSLNTADQTALETLPGVGPVTAAAILQWRSEHGPFTAVEQLLEVSGIGEATLAELEPHVTL